MNTSLTAAIVCGCLSGAVLLGMWLRRLLPAHHLTNETRDTVKLAMGLVATMTALLVGLLKVNPNAVPAVPPALRLGHVGVVRFSAAQFLITLVLFLLAAPFAGQLPNGRFIDGTLLTLMLASGVLAVGGRRKQLVIAAIPVTPAIIGRWIYYFRPDFPPLRMPLRFGDHQTRHSPPISRILSHRMKQSLALLASGCLTLAAGLAAPVDLKLDLSKTNAPISPYIYGQFVEHLGRCIYGGIWAQMLEDRKFYFPITADYAPYKDLVDTPFPVVGASPWQIIGAAAAVSMVKEDAFVGDHSPRINGGGGIRQRDLAFVAGKAYDGQLWAKPLKGPAEIEVALVWGDGDADREAVRLKFNDGKYSRKTFAFKAKGSSDKGRLEIRVLSGDVLLGPPSLMPADNIHGMRPDTIALLKQLNGTVYRWPGGNFASGYDWRDGIGDRDRRPPRKNPAWTGVEHNDFGTDEFMAFCREIGTEPMVAVNTGFGDAYSAAQWVEYCNASTRTIGGGWRAKNGHQAPYGVKFWCVGNEMFGPWQLGFMQMEHYTLKHNLVAEKMWQVDPTLKLTGVGDLTTINKENDPNQAKSGKACSQIMLEQCADHMTMLSEHFYRGRVPWSKDGRTNLLAHVAMLRDAIREKADGHRKLQAGLTNLQGRIVPVTMDEWNFWHREYAYGELGCVYELADGLGVAAGLHEFFRQSDIIRMAHYAQTVNVIGAIKTTKTAAEMETTGLVLQMYRAHFGEIPLRVEQDFGATDISAALTKDGRTLTIGVMNPGDSELELQPSLSGAVFAGAATRWHITGPNAEAHNTPGQPRVVNITETGGLTVSNLRVPPLSAAVFRIALK